MAFNVDENGYLQPLNVRVLRDSRYELLPATRDYFEEIPGRHGEFDFGCNLESRILELHCALEATSTTKPDLVRQIAAYLNPLLGTQTLTFADEPGKAYHVRYAGKIDLTHFIDGVEFTIPFKMCDPFITSAAQKQLTGSGTAVNSGTVETPFVVTITGAVTSPTVSVGGYAMSYGGTVEAAQALVIDTGKMIVILDNVNAMPNYNKVFPKLQPGDNTIAAPVSAVLSWYDQWI